MDTRGKSIEEILRLMQTLDKIEKIDLEEVEAKLNTPVAQALKKQVLDRRIKKKTGRPPLHWKTRKARLKARKKKYYLTVAKPRRKMATLEALGKGDWYEVCRIQWKKRSVRVSLTPDEWEQEIAHTIPQGRIPIVIRYDASKPIALDNIEVIDNETRTVYFSGLDYAFYRAQDSSPQRALIE